MGGVEFFGVRFFSPARRVENSGGDRGGTVVWSSLRVPRMPRARGGREGAIVSPHARGRGDGAARNVSSVAVHEDSTFLTASRTVRGWRFLGSV